MEAVKVDAQQRDADIRKVMFDTYVNHYHSLAAFLQKLPLNADMKSKAALFMDTSFLWAKEAFLLHEAEAQRAQLAEVPPAPVEENASAAVLDSLPAGE